MSDKRRNTKAQKELEETKILVDYLVAHALSFDEIQNFSDRMVKQAKDWWIKMREEIDGSRYSN